VGRSLWREDESVVYNYCCPSPAESFSGPGPVGLATIFYCLRFETFLFVASYDSQSYSRPCIHTGLTNLNVTLLYNQFTRTEQKTPSQTTSLFLCVNRSVAQERVLLLLRAFASEEMCLANSCLAMDVSSYFIIPAFWRHAIIGYFYIDLFQDLVSTINISSDWFCLPRLHEDYNEYKC
jgi:hypothetical protein